MQPPPPRLFATVACLASLLACLPVAQAAVADNRVLVVYDPDTSNNADFQNEAKPVLRAFRNAGIPAAHVTLAALPGGDRSVTFKDLLKDKFEDGGNAAGNTDTKILYYVGHGGRATDDAHPVDEATGTAETKDEDLALTRDDALGGIWAGLAGDKVLIYEMCFAGGMFDGSADPRPANAFFIGSYSSLEKGKAQEFVFAFRLGLRGLADADADSKITAKELQDYLAATVKKDSPPVFDKTAATAGAIVLGNVFNPGSSVSAQDAEDAAQDGEATLAKAPKCGGEGGLPGTPVGGFVQRLPAPQGVPAAVWLPFLAAGFVAARKAASRHP